MSLQKLQAQIDDLRLRIRDLENKDKLRQRNYIKQQDPVLRGGGGALVHARKIAQWTRKDLSVALTVRPTTVMRWERNLVPLQRWRVHAIVKVFQESNATPPMWPIDGWDGPNDIDLWDHQRKGRGTWQHTST